MTDKELIAQLKKAIAKRMSSVCINKPRITKFVINQYQPLTDGGATYRDATCVVTDEYTCPLTRERKIETYKCVFDGSISYTLYRKEA